MLLEDAIGRCIRKYIEKCIGRRIEKSLLEIVRSTAPLPSYIGQPHFTALRRLLGCLSPFGFRSFGWKAKFFSTHPRDRYPVKKILATLLQVGGVVAKLVRRWSRKPEIQSSTLCNARFPTIYFFFFTTRVDDRSAARLTAGQPERWFFFNFFGQETLRTFQSPALRLMRFSSSPSPSLLCTPRAAHEKRVCMREEGVCERQLSQLKRLFIHLDRRTDCLFRTYFGIFLMVKV